MDEMDLNDDIELQHARKLSLVLRRMRADLNDAAVKRLFEWATERNGIHAVIAGLVTVPNPRRQPPIVSEVQRMKEKTNGR